MVLNWIVGPSLMFGLARKLGFPYEQTAAVAFTAAVIPSSWRSRWRSASSVR
jgi:ACR3 family arsenite efflux pump ArsB